MTLHPQSPQSVPGADPLATHVDARRTDDAERVPPMRSEWRPADRETLCDRPERAVGVPLDGHLGRYAIASLLGAGGMGEVLCVRDAELDRDVAAKVARGGAHSRVADTLRLEARLTGQLEHPGIMPVHELGMTADGRPYFTMKRIDGEDLHAVLGRDPPPLTERLRTFLKVCEAIAFAHSRGVIHRDLKPANVMVGAFGEVLVCDWGLAKRIGQSGRVELPAVGAAVGPVTLDGQVMGTPAYMPPEQASGRVAEHDERSDVYALGAILYELLALAPPYSGPSARAILDLVIAGPPAPPSSCARGGTVPRELESVVAKAMARVPADRYSGARELADDVARFLEDRALAAVSYTPSELVLKWVRRHKAAAGIAATALVALACIGAQYWSAMGERARLSDRYKVERDAAERARRQVAIQLRLEHFARVIADTRTASYVHGVDMPARLAQLNAELAPLAALADHEDGRQLASVWLLLGLGRYHARDHAGALAAFERAHRLDPTDTVARFHLGRLYLDRALVGVFGRPGSRVAANVPLEGEARAEFAHARELLDGGTVGSGAVAPIDACAVAAYRAWAEGRVDEARSICEVGLARHGRELGCEDLHLVDALCALRRGDEESGARSIALALSWNPRHAWSRLVSAAEFARHGEYSRALADLDKVLEVDPDWVPALLERAMVHRMAGNLAGALADADLAIAMYPGSSVGRVERANVLVAQGERELARTELDRAVELAPQDPRPLVARGNLRFAARDAPGARADFDQAIAVDDHCADAYFDRGVLERQEGHVDRARADYDRAIAVDPGHVSALLNRGVLRRIAGDVEGAVIDYRAALSRDPREWRGWANLGAALASLGSGEEAGQAFAEALRRAPVEAQPELRKRMDAMGLGPR